MEKCIFPTENDGGICLAVWWHFYGENLLASVFIIFPHKMIVDFEKRAQNFMTSGFVAVFSKSKKYENSQSTMRVAGIVDL